MKKILIRIRTSIKFTVLVCFATFLIMSVVFLIYKPIYSVFIDGNLVGYCSDKTKLQKRISDYIENGDGDNNNLAYVSVEKTPTYNLCLLKRGITTNDDEIFEMIRATGIPYYKYYAILDSDEEKVYVSKFSEAEDIVKQLKEKKSDNIDDLTITEKYETELVDFTSQEDAVSKLYKEKVIVIQAGTSPIKKKGISGRKVAININLIKPITGIITSRFASISSVRVGAHTGLDISAPMGTKVKAAAAGRVVWSGWDKSGLGKLVIISHGNNIETYYGHCSKLYAKVGDIVSQGDVVSAVGSTGNSTGPHLHLEVRVNGIAYNPQYYVY